MPTGRLQTGSDPQRFYLLESYPPMHLRLLFFCSYFSSIFKGGYFYVWFIWSWAVSQLHETELQWRIAFSTLERLILTTCHINMLRTYERFVLISPLCSLMKTCGFVHVGDTCSTTQGKWSNTYFEIRGRFPQAIYMGAVVNILAFIVLSFSDKVEQGIDIVCIEWFFIYF